MPEAMPEPLHLSPRAMLERLIGIPTVSRDSNLALVEFVAEYLASHGVTAQLVYNEDRSKANLYASVGPQRAGGVVLSGHTDVVPIDGQDWATDPFSVVEKDGKLFGRGTCDMKAFSAIGLALVPDMDRLRYPIHFALSYDEEVGCLGAPAMIQDMATHLPAPRAVIVGEPTEMKVVTSHKGILHFDTKITGYEAHSSLQHIGVSAVMVAAKLINWLGARQQANAAEAAADCPFVPAYTTVHCGMIRGGTAANITAGHCEFVTDIRALPSENPNDTLSAYREFVAQEIEPAMQAVNSGTKIEIELCADVPSFYAPDECPAVRLAKQLTGQNESVVQPYAAEAGQFSQGGFAVAMCGPGSISQAHQPNEFISVDQFVQGEQFLRRLIDLLSQE
jgi:acetylornithine deacetylase